MITGLAGRAFALRRFAPLALLLLQTAAAGQTPALLSPTAPRSYPLPDHGALQLNVPTSWKDAVHQPPDNMPPTLEFTASGGRPFEVVLTPVWPTQADAAPLEPADLRRAAQGAVDEAQPDAVEKPIALNVMKGAGGIGYYFFATDRAPKAGEYRYMTQGILRVSDIALSFTILTNDDQYAVIRDGLQLLRTAVHAADGAAPP